MDFPIHLYVREFNLDWTQVPFKVLGANFACNVNEVFGVALL